MALSIFSEVVRMSYGAEDRLPVLINRYAGVGREQRAALEAYAKRSYFCDLEKSKTERATVDEFFRLRNYEVEAFLVKDFDYYERTGVSLGTSVASQVTFDLPSSGENLRDYPVDDANFIVYDDGTPVTVSSVDTDNRQVTLSAAPAAGSVMTADYHFYRLVRLAGRFRWTKLAADWFGCHVELLEVAE